MGRISNQSLVEILNFPVELRIGILNLPGPEEDNSKTKLSGEQCGP